MNWLRLGTIGGLILLHLGVDFFCPRIVFQASHNEKVEGIVLGICMAQLNLIAIWAALTNGRWIVRLPWALLLTMLMWFGLSLGNRLHPESFYRGRFSSDSAIKLGAILLGGALVAQVPLWIARVVFRWR